MIKYHDLTQADASTLFAYDNGVLIWRTSGISTKNFQSKVAGTVAKRGYVHIQYNRKIYKAHRLVYFMHTGELPVAVDHINGVLTDNRIENLRAATSVENQRNAKLRADSTSKVKNVCWHKRSQKWTVQLSVNRKIKHFGAFKDLELATLVAIEAREKYHKEFARHE